MVFKSALSIEKHFKELPHQDYNLYRGNPIEKENVIIFGQRGVPIRIEKQFVHQGADVRLGSAYARQWQ